VSQEPSSILAHAPGYIDKNLELIVGLQTDAPLKRAIMPKGGWRMVETSLKAYGFEPDPEIRKIFTDYCKTHNDGVFDAYTPEIRKCRSSGIITGLPDAYGRGRIIGDYRRLALYGLDFLIAEKQRERTELDEAARDRRGDSVARRALRTAQVAAGHQGDGRALRLRCLQPGDDRA
jgi:formate C-acetyltransferase